MKSTLVFGSLVLFFACSDGQESQTQNSSSAPSEAVPATPEKEVVLSQAALNGKNLYEANCAACHYLDKKLIGPALKGANERYEEAWLIKFIKNSQAMIKAGDPLAKQVYEDNNRMVMNSHEHLSDDEIKSILVYIKEAGK